MSSQPDTATFVALVRRMDALIPDLQSRYPVSEKLLSELAQDIRHALIQYERKQAQLKK